MIELSNSTTQTIEPGAVALFDTTLLHTGCSECHRKGTGVVSLNSRQNGNGCRPIYEITFVGNVESAATLVISLGISDMPETTMVATSGNMVVAHTFLGDCCDNFNTIAVKNNGDAAVTLSANPSFTVKRIA